MLGAVFGFGGRVNRLQFFFGSLGLVFGLMLLMVPLALSLALHQFSPLLFVLVLPAIPASFWISLSLQARRIRDIGWNPAIVIPSVFAIEIIDQLAALAVPHSALGLRLAIPLLGALLNLGLSLCLLFWPGTEGAGEPPAATPKAPKPPKADAPAVSPVRAVQRGPDWAVEGPRATFGRRGL